MRVLLAVVLTVLLNKLLLVSVESWTNLFSLSGGAVSLVFKFGAFIIVVITFLKLMEFIFPLDRKSQKKI